MINGSRTSYYGLLSIFSCYQKKKRKQKTQFVCCDRLGVRHISSSFQERRGLTIFGIVLFLCPHLCGATYVIKTFIHKKINLAKLVYVLYGLGWIRHKSLKRV